MQGIPFRPGWERQGHPADDIFGGPFQEANLTVDRDPVVFEGDRSGARGDFGREPAIGPLAATDRKKEDCRQRADEEAPGPQKITEKPTVVRCESPPRG